MLILNEYYPLSPQVSGRLRSGLDNISGQRGLHILLERHVELSLLIRQAMPGQDNDGVVAAIV